MDGKYIKEQNVIERYLTGQLTKEELDQFSFLLMKDKALQKEVQANRLLFKTLWKANQAADGSGTNTSGKSFNWRIATGLLLFITTIVLLFWLVSQKDSPTKKSPPVLDSVEKTVTESPSDETGNTSTPIESPKENKPEEKQNEEIQIPLVNEKKSVPIAANFEPNPLLETYLTAQRGGEIQITSPEQLSQYTLKDGALTFRLDGNYTPASGQIEEAIQLYLFSNKKEDYEEFRPLESVEFTFTKDATQSHYAFQWQKTLTLQPGLYYYLIEGEDSGLFYTGKFEIR